MPIKIACQCGRQLMVPDNRAGRIVQCPKCSHRVQVPGERVSTSVKELIQPPVPVEEPAPPPVVADPAAPDVVSPPPLAADPAPASGHAAEPMAPLTEELQPAPLAPPAPVLVDLPAPRPIEIVPPPTQAASPPSPQRTPLPPRSREKVPPPSSPAASTTLELPAPPLPPPTPPPTHAPARAVAPAHTPVTGALVSTRPGYQPDTDKLSAAYVLSMLVVVLGVFSLVPGIYDVIRYMRDTDAEFIGRWTFLVFFLGVLQFAYAFYLGQLPDWSSSWVLTGVTLVQASAYASVLTALHLTGGQSQFVEMLDLGPHIDNGHARAWCFVMLCLAGMAAYFCGRISIRWRRAFVLVRDAHRRNA